MRAGSGPSERSVWGVYPGTLPSSAALRACRVEFAPGSILQPAVKSTRAHSRPAESPRGDCCESSRLDSRLEPGTILSAAVKSSSSRLYRLAALG